MLGNLDAPDRISEKNTEVQPSDMLRESGDLLHQLDFTADSGCESASRFLPGVEITQNLGGAIHTDNATIIAQNASQGIDQQFWALSSYARHTNNGDLGCAAAVAEKLQMSGVSIDDAALVSQVNDSLKERGWSVQAIDPLKPGCVAIGHTPGTKWRLGGGKAHLGIVDNSGRICNNESKGGGLWKCEPIADALREKLTRRFQLCPPGVK